MKSFELQPHLVGELLELRPLRREDWEELFAAASDPKIWEQHPAHDRYQENVFKEFFQEALESRGALAAIDRTTRKIIGSSRYFGYDSEKREIEVGWTFLARSFWGGKYNGEMKRLMLGHAFQFVDKVIFLVVQVTSSRKGPWRESVVSGTDGVKRFSMENSLNMSYTKLRGRLFRKLP